MASPPPSAPCDQARGGASEGLRRTGPGRSLWGHRATVTGWAWAGGELRSSFPQPVRRPVPAPTLDPLALSKNLPLPEEGSLISQELWGDQEPLSKIPFKILYGHQHVVSSCQFCVKDTKVLSGSYDNSVKLWDAMDGSVVRDFTPQPSAPVSECSVTADSRRVLAASYDKVVQAWDLETGKLLWKISFETFILTCKFSPDGKYVVSGLDVDHGICITDAESSSTISHIKDHHQKSVTACCFDSDSQRVASVSLDRSVKIWDITSQATVLSITKAHTNAISNCCFTVSGHFLCTSSWDKTLKIWNVHTGEFRNRGACVTLMQGHQGCVSSCQFARDTSLLVSGGFDRTVAIWDVGEGSQKLSLQGHEDWVMDVAVSNDKKWILSASKDGTLRVWNIEEIDEIPLVINHKKTLGLKCERCYRPLSFYEHDAFPETLTKCVFCRMDTKDEGAEEAEGAEAAEGAEGAEGAEEAEGAEGAEVSSSLEGMDSPPGEQSGSDD